MSRFQLTLLAGLLLAAGLPAPSVRAAQPHFYLSTDRAFSSSEKEIYVRLEARAVDYLDMRLYRVADPVKFFRSQPDPHRVVLSGEKVRPENTALLAELWQAALDRAREQVRAATTSELRRWLGSGYRRQLDAVEQVISRPVTRHSVVAPLEGMQLVDSWREPLSAGRKSGWSYRRLHLPVTRPGVYLVEGVSNGEVGRTVVLVSQMLVLTRQSQDRFLVWAVDPDVGSPVTGAEVLLVDGERLLARGKTGDDGTWAVDLPLTNKLVVLARHGEDFALIDPSYYPATLFGRKVYLTTERPVYKPGQQVFFKGVVRAWEDENYRLEEDLQQVKVRAEDPSGQKIAELQLTVSKSGSFAGDFELAREAAGGTYRLLAEVGGKLYGGEFKVKAYVKPTYRVAISSARKVYTAGEKVQATIRANYYFGPPVTQGRVKVTVYRTRFEIPWWVDAEYSWYYSDAEYRSALRETILEKEGKLGDDGSFAVEFATKPESWDFSYGIEAVVIDPANRSVSGRKTIRVTRAPFRIAIEPRQLLFSPGQDASIPVRTTDFEGQPVATRLQVSVSVLAGQDPATAQRVQILDQQIDTGQQGSAQLKFTPQRGGVYTVTASATLPGGHTLQESRRLFVTSDGGDIPYAPEQVEIIADKKSYFVGDRARFLLLVPHADAHLLVTVEGGKLYDAQVMKARGYSRVFEYKIGSGQAPNFVVRVATVFEHFLYQRYLDVVVPPRQKLLKVVVSADRAQARPREEVTFTVQVNDYRGRPVKDAEVALAVVDDAIYAISPDIAVPIEQFFYHRKRNNVRSSCSLDFRFYGYGERPRERTAVLTRRQPVVPGSFKAALGGKVRTRFRDTLAWWPNLVTDEQGRATATVKLADNLTTWRASARVITSDTRVGQGSGKMKVTKPVVVRLAAPEYLVEGDELTMAVLVHNYTPGKLTFTVGLEQQQQFLQLPQQQMQLEVLPGKLGLVTWPVQARQAGEVRLRAFARAGSQQDVLERKLQVLPYGMRQTLVAGGYLDDQHPQSQATLVIPASARAESIKATVTISAGVVPALLSAIDYLVGYPYGCTEQTMSRFLPDLVVARALQDLKLENQQLDEQLPRYIRAGLAHLAHLQHGDGGWGWWTNDSSDPFMTAYVIYGLALARRHGWKVSDDLFKPAVAWLKRQVNRIREENLRAYVLYSLALAGVKYESMLLKLASSDRLTDYSRALLASALFELGKHQQAAQVTGRLVQAVHTSDGTAWWGQVKSAGWRRDAVESTAAVLRTLLQNQPQSELVSRAVRWLLKQRQGKAWYSTRDTAMAVYALVDALRQNGAGEYNARVGLKLNGKELPAHRFTSTEVLKPSVALARGVAARTGGNEFTLTRQGQGDLFYNVSLDYFGREKEFSPRGDKVRVERRLYRLLREETASGWKFSKQRLPARLQPGDEVLVLLQVSASQDADYVMVADPLPAGTRPVDRDAGYRLEYLRLPGVHREFRQDRALFFIRHLRRGKLHLAYILRAELPGTFQMLPARISLMYDPQIAGTSRNHRLVIGE